MPEVTIVNLTKRRIPNSRSIRMAVKNVLELENKKGYAVGITYVDDRRIRSLNRRYRGEDSTTDVLAFGMEGPSHIKGEDKFLGDVIISIDAAQRQSRSFNSTLDDELRLYLIHGLLHLLGYDDRTKTDRRKMRRHEEELLKRLKSRH